MHTSFATEEFLKSSKDYKDSADAVANAIAVLQEYYSSGSFVQSKEEPELGGAKTKGREGWI